MVILQGEIWWAQFGDPTGSEAGFRRPTVVVQGNALTASRIRTVVCVPLTTNLTWSGSRENVLLNTAITGLPKDSVALATQIDALPRDQLEERVSQLPQAQLHRILAGIDIVLGR